MAPREKIFGFPRPAVARILNLLYRRIALGKAFDFRKRLEIWGVLRIENPQYGRLKICATREWLSGGPRLAAWSRLGVLAVVLGATSLRVAGETKTGPARPRVMADLPLYFEVNRGQADPAVQFLARGQACQFFVSPTEAVLALRKMDASPAVPLLEGVRSGFPRAAMGRAAANASAEGNALPAGPVASRVVRMKFVGANPGAGVAGEGELTGKINYFIGNDPAQWHRGVSTFARVRVQAIYPGVDLVYYGNQQRLEYDFVVAPRADPGAIAIRFDGPENIRVDARGDLVLSLGRGEIRQPGPMIYQDVGGVRKKISGGYQLAGRRTLRFKIGEYDRARPLVIDPVLSYSTYFGGDDSDTAWGVAVDTNGFVYVAGETLSAQLATPGAFQTTNAGNNVFGDAFVAKFDNTASSLVYLTYLGGNADDFALALALDGAGNVYLTGYTDSTNFPLRSAIYTNLSGSPYPELPIGPTDAFVAKLDASGSNLVYSTFLGGSGLDLGIGIAVDPAMNVYVAGYTESTNLPTQHAFATNYAGGGDAFAVKIDATGTNVFYSMYLGGTNQSVANDVAADPGGNAYLVISDTTTNGSVFAVVQKLSPTGTPLNFYSALGDGGRIIPVRITRDTAGDVYIAGSVDFTNFPATSSFLSDTNPSIDALLIKLAGNDLSPIYRVVMGGSGKDEARDVAVDAAGNAHVIGDTTSANFPTNNTSGFLRGVNSGGTDVFVAEVNSNGTALVYAAYLGGGGEDLGYGIAVDALDNTYIAGETTSADFPTLAARQTGFAGVKDAFLAKILQPARPTLAIAASGTNVVVTWPAIAPEFVLITHTNVQATNGWRIVDATPVVTNGQQAVTLPATNNSSFFDLYLLR
jgi:hypothetical protein